MQARLHRRALLQGTAALAATSAFRPAWADGAMGFADARHLLSRATFGGTPAEIAEFAALDFRVGVDRLLGKFRRQAGAASPDWVNQPPTFLRQQGAAQAAKDGVEGKAIQIVQQQVREQGRQLRNWWVEEMLSTDQPLVERMTLFWHNHFTSSVQKVRYVPSLFWQNALFRGEALGNFATLLKAVARDPAMLIYLDGVRSVARQPNENFGRELLELFTLGEGHYGEADIKAAARAFTGRSIDRETGHFQNHGQQHDGGEKTFLGRTGRFDGDQIVAILLEQPRTAETIVAKLWREFVSLTPDPAEVSRLAGIFRDGGYEVKPLLRALFLSPAFRAPANHATLIKSPIDLIVGTVRLLGLPVPEKTQLVRMLQGLGQSPFDPPNVKGWPGGEAWITTYTLLLRQQFLRRMIEATTVSPMGGPVGAGRRGGGEPMEVMEPRPIEGRSLRNAGNEARLGATLSGVDPATLMKTFLPCPAIDGVEAGSSPGAVVAAAMLDPAYQLK